MAGPRGGELVRGVGRDLRGAWRCVEKGWLERWVVMTLHADFLPSVLRRLGGGLVPTVLVGSLLCLLDERKTFGVLRWFFIWGR